MEDENEEKNLNVKSEVEADTEADLSDEENCELDTVELKNVMMETEELSNAVIIGEYDEDNSDQNLIIDNEQQIVRTYIVRQNFDSSDTIQEYFIESEESGSHHEVDEVVIEQYMEAIKTTDSLETETEGEEKICNEIEEDPDFEATHQNSQKSNDFECNTCNRSFKTAIGLKRHTVLSHPSTDVCEDDPLTLQICACCGDPLDSNTHTVGDYQCTICSKLFIQKSILDRHTSLEHPKGDNYKCSECKFICSRKVDFEHHLQTHSFKMVKCICNKEFTRKYHLERHLQISGCGGSKADPMFKCEVCSKEFYRKDNFRVHLKTHSTGIKKEKSARQCQFCNKEFSSVGLLTVHVRTHTGEKPYACEQCDKRFPSTGALKKHVRVHTGEKPYVCKFCSNRFAAKETLNRHIRVHTGEKPHSCKFCGKSFIQAAQLRAHIFHHTGENAYICQYCNRGFNRKLRLTTHIKYMHEGAEPLHCKDCDKTFFRKEDLSRHTIQHTGERPFVCEICEKSFAVKSSLKLHKLTHNKEVPCTCEYCGRVFIRQDCLMRHMRARHREFLEDIMISAEKKRLQQQLLGAISEAAEQDQKSIVESTVWNEFTLTESIKELLTLLVDDDCLKELGYPDTPVDKVLGAVIRRCGHEPVSDKDFDYIGRLRENAKLLFTAVIDDEAVKSLLNNQTVDEVILHVLRLANKT